MMKFIMNAAAALVVGWQGASAAELPRKLTRETAEQKAARLAWWTDARFGMFIHFGLYSVLAGVGEDGATDLGEWIKSRQQYSDAEYDRFLPRFDPDLFDAREWARTAKRAGMKYVVLTAKHHEGFCLWDTKTTDYKITKTAFGRDLVREYVDALRAEGLKVGLYFSIIDWHHPDFTIDVTHPLRPKDRKDMTPEKAVEVNKGRDMDRYRAYMFAQARELLTDYGKIDVFWFDYTARFDENPSWGKTWRDWNAVELLKMARTLQPGIIVDNRLDLMETEDGWDFLTPEQFKAGSWPTHRGKRVPWETCQTFSGSWGYCRDQDTWKSMPQLIGLLSETVSKGGNLIMNVGPTARGVFDERALERLDGFAKWMRFNARSIYGCTMAPEDLVAPSGTAVTYNPKTRRAYIHLYEYPMGRLPVSWWERIDYAQFLHDGSRILVAKPPEPHPQSGDTQGTGGLVLPIRKPGQVVPVVEVWLKSHIRPHVTGGLVAPEDGDYLRRKFREDVTGCGLGTTALAEGGLRLAKEKVAAGVPWQVAKAEVFAWLCDSMGVAASEHDFFPAISAYDRLARPMMKVLAWRDAEVDERHLKREKAAVDAGFEAGRFSMWKDFDHSVPDWDELLAGGWPMLERRLEKYEKPTPYYRALRITLEACLRTVERFAAAARTAAARASSPAARARLEKEAAAFAAIRSAPPRTVYEALAFQFSYFFLSEHMDGLQVRSLGAIDQLLTPFYRADLAAGRITPDEFRTLLAHYWWQWGSIDNYWGQPVALGGTNRDGSSAFNEVSDLVLDVHDALALPTPKMLVKIATNTPERVFRRMLDLVRRHRSITFDSEETMAKILKAWRGCTDEECRVCALNGCYEFYAPEQNVTQSSHISFLQPVHDILVRYAKQKEGALPETFEAFKAAYFEELKRNTLECCDLTDAWERYLGEINPANVYTLTSERAMKAEKDAYYNGLRFNDTALLSVGLGTSVDALLAVKEIVYERKELTLPQLGELMAANWKGGEDLRRRMLRSKRKWGNNDAEANALGHELAHTVGGWVNGRRNGRSGIWGFSGHPAKQFVYLAYQTGATPDGRLATEESSKNVSPTMGMDTEGVTALVETLAHLDPLDMPVNLPLDVMLHPSSVQGEKGLDLMHLLARHYFRNGGITIQFNVVSVDELRDAQRHPEKYENLQVRVCGWNVRWNDIPKREQDKYILRAERVMQ